VVSRAVGATVEQVVDPPLQESVDDRLNEIGLMEHLAESRQRFVGRDDGRSQLQVPLAEDAEEDVGGVCSVAMVAEFVLRRTCGCT